MIKIIVIIIIIMFKVLNCRKEIKNKGVVEKVKMIMIYCFLLFFMC